jgi:predicted transcriptional regulator
MTYRNKLDISADILTVASRNAKRTQIMYQANLSYKVMRKYLDEVVSASLRHFETEQQCYLLTAEGKEFLVAYKEYCRTHKHVKKGLGEICTKRKILEDLYEST